MSCLRASCLVCALPHAALRSCLLQEVLTSSLTSACAHGTHRVGSRPHFVLLLFVCLHPSLLQPALLVYIKGSGTWWLNATLQCSPELQCAYWSAGWLMAQSITNRCTLGIPIAPLLFHLLVTPTEALQVHNLTGYNQQSTKHTYPFNPHR
jgi:hypothetical protein